MRCSPRAISCDNLKIFEINNCAYRTRRCSYALMKSDTPPMVPSVVGGIATEPAAGLGIERPQIERY